MLGSSQEAAVQTPSLLELSGEHEGTPHSLLVVPASLLTVWGYTGCPCSSLGIWKLGYTDDFLTLYSGFQSHTELLRDYIP